jgi:hypothetical protein
LKRAILLLSFILATTTFARERPLPIPPVPPSVPPPMDAPVPDLDIQVPSSDPIRSPVTLDPLINHRESPGMGFGYAPGARYQLDNDRRFLVLPGILVRLPLP